MNTLEEKIIDLNNLVKQLLIAESIKDTESIQDKVRLNLTDVTLPELTFEDIQSEIKSIFFSREISKNKLDKTVAEINQLHMIQVTGKENDQSKKEQLHF